MEIFLAILSFIGIFFAVLFFVIVLFLALVVLVPFSYKFTGGYASSLFFYRGVFSWLFGAIAVVMEGNSNMYLRVFWVKVKGLNSGHEEKKENVVQNAKQNEAVNKEQRKQIAPTEKRVQDDDKLHKKDKKKPTRSRKVKKKGLIGNIKEVIADYKEYKEMLKPLIKPILNYCKTMVKTVSPKYLDVSGKIGFEDPSTTGIFAGGVAMVRPFFKWLRLEVVPDFQNEEVDIKFRTAGRITILFVMIPTVRLIFEKQVFDFIMKMLRK